MLFKSFSFACIVVATSAVTFLFQPPNQFGEQLRMPFSALIDAGAESSGQRESAQEPEMAESQQDGTANVDSAIDKVASSHGKPTLGVHVSELMPSLAAHVDLVEGVGLLVEHVVEGSSAEKAGLEQHDVLVKLQGQWLINQQQLGVLVKMNQGQEIELQVVRQGTPMQLTAKLTESSGVESSLAEFDAFFFYHGQAGKREFQNCSVCHAASVKDIRDGKNYDNYEFFHGKVGSEELKKCSTCHQAAPRELDIRRSM